MTEFLTYTSAQEIVETIEEIRTQLQEKGSVQKKKHPFTQTERPLCFPIVFLIKIFYNQEDRAA